MSFSEADILSRGVMCYIYTLHASNDPECRPRYVGLTRDFARREKAHNYGKPHGRKGEWVKEVRASGGEVVLVVVFQFRSGDLTECGVIEGTFINNYRQLYPDLLNDAGAGAGICLASEKTRALISKSSKGRKWPKEACERASKMRLGKPLSEKHKQNISKGNKGKKLSPEHAAKARVARLGIPHSEEIKRKISEGGKGKKRNPEKYRQAAAKRYADPLHKAEYFKRLQALRWGKNV